MKFAELRSNERATMSLLALSSRVREYRSTGNQYAWPFVDRCTVDAWDAEIESDVVLLRPITGIKNYVLNSIDESKIVALLAKTGRRSEEEEYLANLSYIMQEHSDLSLIVVDFTSNRIVIRDHCGDKIYGEGDRFRIPHCHYDIPVSIIFNLGNEDNNCDKLDSLTDLAVFSCARREPTARELAYIKFVFDLIDSYDFDLRVFTPLYESIYSFGDRPLSPAEEAERAIEVFISIMDLHELEWELDPDDVVSENGLFSQWYAFAKDANTVIGSQEYGDAAVYDMLESIVPLDKEVSLCKYAPIMGIKKNTMCTHIEL